jgi:undecaprenyl-diphosphatase
VVFAGKVIHRAIRVKLPRPGDYHGWYRCSAGVSLNAFQAAVLGLVQGLTEFLPKSSSRHLILVPWLVGWEPHGLAFDAALHLGTVVALLVYFWRDWLRLIRAVLAGLTDAAARRDPDWRLSWLLLLGSIPAGLIGLALESTIERLVRQPWSIALLLAVFGLLLWYADRAGSKLRDLEKIGVRDALVIGLAQVLALAPGVSRSGITLTAGLLLGLDRSAAARFSFLLSTPITLAAALFSLRKIVGPGSDSPGLGVFLVGVVSAAIFGLRAVGFLRRYIQRNSLTVFVGYRIAIAALVLAVQALGAR